MTHAFAWVVEELEIWADDAIEDSGLVELFGSKNEEDAGGGNAGADDKRVRRD